MNTYYCSACGKYNERDSKRLSIRSWCSTHDRYVRIRRSLRSVALEVFLTLAVVSTLAFLAVNVLWDLGVLP